MSLSGHCEENEDLVYGYSSTCLSSFGHAARLSPFVSLAGISHLFSGLLTHNKGINRSTFYSYLQWNCPITI